ncbi:MAG: helix-turn-helix transcriptional regulator [Enterobacter sp.]|nr:helix-turn-helix transcriptional regulator [Enterobacter sp.]
MALMSEPVVSRQDDTRKQLGAFLRARRESLDPQRLGLPRSGRRRTPGLRREEVAMLADVGVTWYTWLEQGRDVNPSSAVMAAVAKALQCTPTEARHLFVLAGLPPGEAPQAVCCEGISEGTRRLLDTLMPKPASIQKPNFDIVAWNDSFGHLMGVDFNDIPPEDRNCIYLFLTHPAWRARLGRRDDVWHQRNDVRGVENQLKLFTHPELGDFTLQQMYWYSAPRNGSRLLVYLPVDEAGERAMAWLAAQGK